MDVDPHKSLQPPLGSIKPASRKRVAESSGDTARVIKDDGTVFHASDLQQVIRQSLESMPEVRQELVEIGRELAEDENYPSAEGLDELGRLVLQQFSQTHDGEGS